MASTISDTSGALRNLNSLNYCFNFFVNINKPQNKTKKIKEAKLQEIETNLCNFYFFK